jgi:hypothetical protein
MLQCSTLENNAEIIWLLSALLLLGWMSICCTGASLMVLVMELSTLVVILEATAKNSSRLNHCIEVCDNSPMSELWLQHSTFFLMLKEGHQSSIHHESF